MTERPAFLEIVELTGARALFSTRHGGVSDGPYASLNLGLTGDGEPDRAERVAANRSRALAATGRSGVALGRQVHGSVVARVEAPMRGYRNGGAAADGQATARGDVAVAVHVADCLPVALAADGAVAMLHAGWRGLACGVIEAGVAALRELGARARLHAAIGPGAGRCCYEAGEEVHAAFSGYGADVRAGANIDLKLVARRALGRAGVQRVDDVELCTICSSQFFSHRRDAGLTGRQAGFAWRS